MNDKSEMHNFSIITKTSKLKEELPLHLTMTQAIFLIFMTVILDSFMQS